MTHLKLPMLPSQTRVLKRLSCENSSSTGAALSFACFAVFRVDVCLTVLSHSQLVFLPSCHWFEDQPYLHKKPCEKKKRTSCIILQQEAGRQAAKVERLEILRG